MANAQPLNATISVFRRARVVFDNRRHTSIKALTTPFDTKLVSVPGEEIQVLETRDGVKSDAFQFGHPVVIYPRNQETLKGAFAAVPNLAAVKLPGNEREVQVETTAAGLRQDLYGQLRAAQAGSFHS